MSCMVFSLKERICLDKFKSHISCRSSLLECRWCIRRIPHTRWFDLIFGDDVFSILALESQYTMVGHKVWRLDVVQMQKAIAETHLGGVRCHSWTENRAVGAIKSR